MIPPETRFTADIQLEFTRARNVDTPLLRNNHQSPEPRKTPVTSVVALK